MQIINIGKYISFIENNNLLLYFYKKDLYCIVDNQKSILYIKNKKDINSIDVDIEKYKIIEYKFLEEIYNKIQLNNKLL